MRGLGYLPVCIAASIALGGTAEAAVITFNNLQRDPGQLYGNFTTYTEDGYTATNRGGFSGSFYNGYITDSGQTPEISGVIGTVSITGFGLFSVTSFDAFFSSPDPSSSYTVTGYVAGVSVYMSNGSIARGPASGGGSPLTTYSGFASTPFDRIDIAVSGNGVTYLDNITVSPAPAAGAVPEPATWAMLLVGFGLLGGTLRRSQWQASRVA